MPIPTIINTESIIPGNIIKATNFETIGIQFATGNESII